MTRPTVDIPQWNPSETNVDIPDTAKQNLGWIYKEKVGYDRLNWFQKRVSTWMGWLIDRTDAHETRENVTMTFATDGYTAIQEFFDNLKHNDYTITITDGGSHADEVLRIEDISGNGSIIFNGASLTLGGLLISNVKQSNVSFIQSFGTAIQRSGQYGVRIVNSPYVFIETLSIAHATDITAGTLSNNYRLLSVDSNSKLVCYDLTTDADYEPESGGSGVPTKYVCEVMENSFLEITNNGTFSETGSPTISAEGYAYFYKDDTSKISIDTPSFSTALYGVQILSTKLDMDFDITPVASDAITSTAVVRLLNTVKEININLTASFTFSELGDDIEMENVSGFGTLTIDGLSSGSTNYASFKNVKPFLELSDFTISEGVLTTGALYLENVKFLISEILSSNITLTDGVAIMIVNSKGVIESYIPTVTTTKINGFNHINITENSDVTIESINTTVIDIAISIARVTTTSRAVFKSVTKPADPKYVTIYLPEDACQVIASDVTPTFVMFINAGTVSGNLERIY